MIACNPRAQDMIRLEPMKDEYGARRGDPRGPYVVELWTGLRYEQIGYVNLTVPHGSAWPLIRRFLEQVQEAAE